MVFGLGGKSSRPVSSAAAWWWDHLRPGSRICQLLVSVPVQAPVDNNSRVKSLASAITSQICVCRIFFEQLIVLSRVPDMGNIGIHAPSEGAAVTSIGNCHPKFQPRKPRVRSFRSFNHFLSISATLLLSSSKPSMSPSTQFSSTNIAGSCFRRCADPSRNTHRARQTNQFLHSFFKGCREPTRKRPLISVQFSRTVSVLFT